MDCFQCQNVLLPEDYETLQVEKRIIHNQEFEYLRKNNARIPSVTVSQDGTLDKDVKRVEPGSFRTWRFDIEDFKLKYPDIIPKLLYQTKTLLEQNTGFNNFRPYMGRLSIRNNTVQWHKHKKLNDVPSEKWFCVIYYMHSNWDTNFGGSIRVSKVPDLPGVRYECISNSFVAHNAHYGHAVETLHSGFKEDRDIFLSHWISD